jgi:hypothetical protein
MAQLDDLRINGCSQDSVIATELTEAIKNNRNRLIDDEVELMKRLGLSVSVAPRRLSYYKNSERVTVSWSANINSISSKIMAALVISPRHPTKSQRLSSWLQTRSRDEIDGVMEDLRKREFSLE